MRIWSHSQAVLMQQMFRRRTGQLTTVDAAQYPGQRTVLTPSDGRGLVPPSEVTYLNPLIRYVPRETVVGVPGQRPGQVGVNVTALAGPLGSSSYVARIPGDRGSQLVHYQTQNNRGGFTQFGTYGEPGTGYGRG